jgi:Domain of unknown function (DUF4399)
MRVHSPMTIRATAPLAAFALAVFVSACGGGSEAPAAGSAPAAAPAAQAAAPAGAQPRVFFVQPTDGATVKSPVHIQVGMENYQQMAVPQGTVEMAREGVAHQHIGVDTQCLPVGETIPKADPWVHLGSGASEMDMQLPPGDHTLTVQAGDDLHKTLPNMCSTITVHVTP